MRAQLRLCQPGRQLFILVKPLSTRLNERIPCEITSVHIAPEIACSDFYFWKIVDDDVRLIRVNMELSDVAKNGFFGTQNSGRNQGHDLFHNLPRCAWDCKSNSRSAHR